MVVSVKIDKSVIWFTGNNRLPFLVGQINVLDKFEILDFSGAQIGLHQLHLLHGSDEPGIVCISGTAGKQQFDFETGAVHLDGIGYTSLDRHAGCGGEAFLPNVSASVFNDHRQRGSRRNFNLLAPRQHCISRNHVFLSRSHRVIKDNLYGVGLLVTSIGSIEQIIGCGQCNRPDDTVVDGKLHPEPECSALLECAVAMFARPGLREFDVLATVDAGKQGHEFQARSRGVSVLVLLFIILGVGCSDAACAVENVVRAGGNCRSGESGYIWLFTVDRVDRELGIVAWI